MSDSINIAIAVDNNLKYYASTMLISLFENNPQSTFHFYIVTDTIYLKDIEYTFKIIQKYKSNYTVITLSEEQKTLLSSMIVSSHVTYFAYIRLLLPELLPLSIDKILYLDIDLLIIDSIEPLWNIDISKHSLAAVTLNSRLLSDALKEAKALLNVPLNTPYINSGVLLMNLHFFRTTHIVDKMVDFIVKYPNFIEYWDQDALNLFLYDSLLEIDKCWNMDGHNANAHPEIKPVIIHYTGSHKPLTGYNTHPYKDEFMKYFKKNYLYKFYVADKVKTKLKKVFKIDQ